MDLNTGFDVAFGGNSLNQINIMNNEGAIASYFELSTGLSGCPILTNDGQVVYNSRWNALQQIVNAGNSNLEVGFYHFLYDPNYVSNAMSCYEQGVVFGMSLTNENIPSTYLSLVLDVEWASFDQNTPSVTEVENCVSEFMNGLNSTISGDFNVMLYLPYSLINALELYNSSLTDYTLWLTYELTNIDPDVDVNVQLQLTNSQIEQGINLMNSVTWGGYQGWSGWQYALSGQGNLYIDLDIFNMDAIYNSGMYYNPTN